MTNAAAFDNLSNLAMTYENQLIENLQTGNQIVTQQAAAVMRILLEKIPEKRRKLSAYLKSEEIKLLYQLLQAEELSRLKTDPNAWWYAQVPYRLIMLKNAHTQSGDQYFHLPIRVINGVIEDNEGMPYTGQIRNSSGLPKKNSFVITKTGELKLGVGHYYLAGNQPTQLLGAGVVRVHTGKIITAINDSNHFRPTRLEFISSLRFLANLQVLHPQLEVDEVPNTI